MKNFKKIFVLLLVLSIGASMIFGMTSCTEPENTDTPCTEHADTDGNGKCDKCEADVEPAGDGKVDYVVTVTDEDGNPVEGATVVIYLNGLSERGEENTGADGKVTFRLKEGSYSASVVSAPSIYTYDEEAKIELVNNAATIEIEKLPAFTIYVVDANGQAVSGVEVQLCSTTDRCLTPQLTDESGKVVYYAVEDSYKAKITDSYAKDHGHSNYDYKLLADGQVTLTLQAQ
jgi:hypothetical protein